MDKPIPGELRNVDVQFVSLVNKGANRRQFKIFKSANWPEEGEPQNPSQQPPGSEEQEMRGFFQVLKQFFTGSVKKADEEQVPSFSQAIQAADTEDLIWKSFSTLRDVVRGILGSNVQDKTTKVALAVEEFKTYLVGKLNQIGIAKALELYTEQPYQLELEKAGRKISTARLKSLKDAHNLIGKIIAEAETDNQSDSKEGTEVSKEELTKMVAEAVNEATKPISERLEKLEKQAEEQEQTDGATQGQEELQNIIKEAVSKAVKPLEERLEVVEKARGISNKVPEEKDKVEKSEGESFWGGAFLS
ncbi:MAG: hypothetical protein PWR10_1790 [Halanaerobiales bacterium]|nr:hypothetical protein [Halanaerobiales bacterium]